MICASNCSTSPVCACVDILYLFLAIQDILMLIVKAFVAPYCSSICLIYHLSITLSRHYFYSFPPFHLTL